MNRTETKKKLKEALPKGFLEKIQTMLSAKGIETSISKISKCCNPDLADWDNDIIEAAIYLMESEKEREENLKSRIKAL